MQELAKPEVASFQLILDMKLLVAVKRSAQWMKEICSAYSYVFEMDYEHTS